MIKLKTFFLCFFLLISTTACAEESSQSLSPENVLYGTDVKPTSFFHIKKNKQIQGSYVAEMGGASLSLEITKKDKGFMLKRVFVEPGMPAENKEYILAYSGAEFKNNGKVKLVVVDKGILLFEAVPGSYGVPPDMWVYYEKK